MVHCDRCQEILSAQLDGESSTIEDAAAARHVARCAPCASQAGALRRLGRSPSGPDPRPATGRGGGGHRVEGGPDLTVRILARLAWSPGSEAPDWARYGLLVVALTQVVLALPQLVARGRGLYVHDLHHLGAWELAFGVGLVVVAWQPERARGLLPMAAALAFGMAVTAAFDVFDRTIPISDEAHHLFDFAGVFLLWVVGRSFRLRPTRLRQWRNRQAPAAPGPGEAGPAAKLQACPPRRRA